MTSNREIMTQISRNRISTSEVSDALGKKGVLAGIKPLNDGHFVVGEVRYVYAYKKSNWELHKQLEDIREGEVIVVDAIDCDEYAVFGSLVAKFCLLYRQVAAMVVLGMVRDVAVLKKENYAIWSEDVTPLGCFNTPNERLPDEERLRQRSKPFEGAIAICDDSGVVIIPKQEINADLATRLEHIELQEDAWFHSIDTDGYSTYETVCLKKYLDEGSVFTKYDQLLKSED